MQIGAPHGHQCGAVGVLADRTRARSSGCLDEEEFLQLHADLLRNGLVEESAEEIIASMDRDSDGIVTLTEFLGWYISRGALAAHVQ